MNRMAILAAVLLFITTALVPSASPGGEMSIVLTSTEFEHEGSIPEKYSCDDADVSPPLDWQNVPPEAMSLVLICEDPDAPAGVFDHWVLYNLPASASSLPEGVEKHERLGNAAMQGRNSFGRIGYNGPCPPRGTHRYYFRLYALDRELDLQPGASKQQVQNAMEGAVMAQGELMGRYSR